MRMPHSGADSKAIKTNSYCFSWGLACLSGAKAETVPGNIGRRE
jgi:hypothetical protein